MRATALSLAAAGILLAAANAAAQIDTAILRPVGYHPSHVAYYNAPFFANALHQGGEWFEFSGFEHGTQIDFNARPTQFLNGYPQFLQPNLKLRAVLFGLNIVAWRTHRGSRREMDLRPVTPEVAGSSPVGHANPKRL